jgi:hypothetical protein
MMSRNPSLSSSLVVFSLAKENNNEPIGSLSYSAFFSVVENDDEPPNLSSSSLGFIC